MEPGAVAWGWPLAALVAGLVVGSVLVWRMRRAPRGPAPETAAVLPLELRDLDGRLDVLVLHLRELVDLPPPATRPVPRRYAELQPRSASRARSGALAGVPAGSQWEGRGSGGPIPAAAADLPRAPVHAAHVRGFVWCAATVAALASPLLLEPAKRPARRGTSRAPAVQRPRAMPSPAQTASDADDEAELRPRSPNPDDSCAAGPSMCSFAAGALGVLGLHQYVWQEPSTPGPGGLPGARAQAMGQGTGGQDAEGPWQGPDVRGVLHLALVPTRAGHTKRRPPSPKPPAGSRSGRRCWPGCCPRSALQRSRGRPRPRKRTRTPRCHRRPSRTARRPRGSPRLPPAAADRRASRASSSCRPRWPRGSGPTRSSS